METAAEATPKTYEDLSRQYNFFGDNTPPEPLEVSPTCTNKDLSKENLNIDFPRDAIKGFIREYADTYSEYFESPYEFWVFFAAVFLGSLLVQRVRLNTSLRTEPRLYAACIGQSGIARKSEAKRQTNSFFKPLIHDRKIGVCQGVGSANGLARFLREHPCGILQIDEMRSIIQKIRIKNSVLLETLTSLFDDNCYSNYTKDEEVRIEDASLSFIGCTTLEIWEKMFSSSDIDTGLINRLWVVPGHAGKVVPRPNMPPAEQLRLMERMREILKAFPEDQAITLQMEAEAEKAWNNWYREYRTNETNSDITTRLDTYGDRLMMILCASEGKTTIDADLVKSVIRLLEWQKNVRLIYQPKDFDNCLARVEGKVRTAGLTKKDWRRSDLYYKIHADRFGLDVFKRALSNLAREGVLKIDMDSKPEKILFI